MALMITSSETGNGSIVLTKVNTNLTADNFIVTPAEQQELLEALARNLDFTLVDRVERESLVKLVEEIEDDPNMYDVARGWKAWQDHAEALASAVSSALRVETEV